MEWADSRSVAHRFHTAGRYHALVAGLDSLGREDDRLHAASADLVDGRRIRAGLHARPECDLPSRRLADASLHNVAKVELFNNGRVDLGGLEGMLEGDNTELGRSDRLEDTIDRANGRARRGNDDSFVDLLRRVSVRKLQLKHNTHHGARKKGGEGTRRGAEDTRSCKEDHWIYISLISSDPIR